MGRHRAEDTPDGRSTSERNTSIPAGWRSRATPRHAAPEDSPPPPPSATSNGTGTDR
jgi:hypothetical protein